MNSDIVDRWNSVVSKADTVFYVGDLSAGLSGRTAELIAIINSMNGKKILIRGNHDHQTDEWYITNGFFSVFDVVNIAGVLLVHYPLTEAIKRGILPTSVTEVEHVVHGHVHRVEANFENHFNVAVDRNNFTPVTLETAVPKSLRSAFISRVDEMFA